MAGTSTEGVQMFVDALESGSDHGRRLLACFSRFVASAVVAGKEDPETEMFQQMLQERVRESVCDPQISCIMLLQ